MNLLVNFVGGANSNETFFIENSTETDVMVLCIY